MAAVSLSPLAGVSNNLYNKLPSLQDVKEEFARRGGDEIIKTLFKNLLVDYNVESALGVGLLHRHFDLDKDERIVEFNNISVPWNVPDDSKRIADGEILPAGWFLDGETLVPYEFAYNPLKEKFPIDFEKLAPFLEKFKETVKMNGLENVIALRVFPGQGFEGFLEITEGRANINLLPSQFDEHDAKDSTETQWFFDEEYDGRHYKCRCKKWSGNMHFQTPY